MELNIKVIGEYPNCPQCGNPETISHLATAGLRESGKIAEDTPTQTRMVTLPLEVVTPGSKTAEVCFLVYDICAGCGLERLVRAEVAKVPVDMPNPKLITPPGFRGFPPPGKRLN